MNSTPFQQFHLYDLHVHTFFSDGQHDFDEVLNGLIDLGIKIVGFNDHLFPGAIYFHKEYPEWKMVRMHNREFLERRKRYIRLLDKKYPQIKILCGAEIDILPNGTLTLPRGIGPEHFDYLSVVKHHTLPIPIFPLKKFPHWGKWLWKHDPYLRLNNYMYKIGIQAAFSKYHPDILCHPEPNMPKYMTEEEIKWFMALLKKYNIAYELNHFPDNVPPYQAGLILKYGKKYGVLFSLGSDFHGFTKDPQKIREQLNHSQEMYEIAEKYGLKLLDARKFLK